MHKLIVFLSCVIVVNCGRCFAQSSGTPEFTYTNWGESVNGVRMSAVLETNSYAINSALRVYVRIENQSTNEVRVHVSNPLANFKVVLNDAKGKRHVYHIEREIENTLNFTKTIKSGGHWDEDVAIQIQKEIDVGDCTITVSRFVSSKQEGKFEIQSNVMKAKITR
jgi:hypothetical protein